jgi:plasmid replication initiation protein
MKNQTEIAVVVKSNRLIEASYRLSMVEMQLLLIAVAQARASKAGLSAETPVKIRASDFAAMFNTDPKSVYRQVREAVNNLFERQVMFHDIDEEGFDRVNRTRWLSDVAYVDASGNVSLTFSPKLLPYLVRLESEFTTYRLKQIGHLSSVYAVRMYELLTQYKSLGAREFEIDNLRYILGLTTEYLIFADFRVRVLDVAVAQINEHTDIKVKYETRKTGRKITHLDFKIKDKSEAPKRLIINDDLIKKNARPGETTEQVRERLRKERDAKKSTQPR